jgi:hypothetical protein
MDIEPLELIVLVFPGTRANPAVAEILGGVVSRGYVTVLDLAFVTRTSDGSMRITDVDGNRHEIGLGSLEVSAQPLITKDHLDAVRGSLKPGTSAAVIAYEHSWVRRLAGAVTNAGGAIARTAMSTGTASVTAEAPDRGASPGTGQQQQFAAHQSQQQAVAESEAAVREAEAEAAAAERAAEQYATFRPQQEPSAATGDDLAGQLRELAMLRESGALTQQEFEAAKSRLLNA